MKRIGFDIDGVILNLHTHLIKEFKKQYGIDLRLFLTEFIFTVPGLDDDDISYTIEQTILKTTKVIRPFKTVKETLVQIFEQSKEPILFVTARELHLKDATEKSLENNFKGMFEYETIYTGEIGNKLQYLQAYDIGYFTEDNPDTCNEISQFLTKTFLVNRVYNVNHKTFPDVIRINFLSDIISHIYPTK
jgi:uncharacterized HAD superfamily protein